MSRRAVIYARQSLDRTGEALAVTRQLEDCRDLAKRKGWQVVAEHVDNDLSASNGKPRPEYRRLLDSVRGGHVEAVVAWSADRLTRRPVEVEELIDAVEAHGAALALVSGDVDLSTPYGRAVARIFGAIARQEVEQKGARQARANRQRAEAGNVNWTRRPFGYERESAGSITVVDSEAEELRRAAQHVLAGGTLAAVARDLNSRGVRTSTGARWAVSALRRVLLNPRHAGLAVYRGAEIGEGTWPAILTEDQHRQLVAVLTDPRRRTAPTTVPKYLLSGLALCGRCGERLFASPMGRKGGYWMAYRCRTAHLARRLDLVDNVVTEIVLGRLARPDAAALLSPDRAEEAGELLEESVTLRGRLDELASLLADGTLTAAGVRDASAKLRGRLEEVDRLRVQLVRDDGMAALAVAQDVREVWAALPLRSRRAVIDLLLTATVLPVTKGARFTPEQVRIDWKGNAE